MPTPGITLTATLEDITGQPAGTTSNPARLEIVLCNYGTTLPQIAGTATIAQIVKVVQSTGSAISEPLWGNDVITPTGQTFYMITVFDGNNRVVQSAAYRFTGAQTIDLSNATPLVPPVPSPAGYTPVYTNLPGTPTQTINGNITIDGNLIVTGSVAGGGLYVVPIVGGVAKFDAAQGLLQSLTLTQNVTSTMDNMPTGVAVRFLIKQDGTGHRTMSWPAGFTNGPRVNPAASARTRTEATKDELGAIDFWPSAVAGVNFDNLPSTTTDVPVATTADSSSWRQLDQDDILPGFTIVSFSGGSSVEIGTTVTNPAFTASYSATPVSANITNTDGIDSPLNLTTPFTSGTVVGSFVKTAAATTTFTLSATGTGTKTATQAISWLPRTFGGVGTAGATGATASGNNATLGGATGTLASAGLNNQGTYGPYTAASQKIYILMIGGTHTFKDTVSGFAVPMKTPTLIAFVNQHGATVAMYLYETTEAQIGTLSLEVA